MLKNVFSNWIAIAVIGLTTILLTPFLIHHLGNLEFGVWVLVSSICGYSGLLEFGLRATVQRYVARFRGLNDRESLNRTFTVALFLTATIAVFVFLLTMVLAWVLPAFFGLTGARGHAFGLLLVVLGINVGVSLVALLLGTYLCGWQRFELYNLGAVGSTLAQAGLIVVALHHGYGVVAMGLATLLVTLILLPCNWKMVRWADPRLRLNWKFPTRAEAAELLGFSWWMFLTNMGIQLRTFTDSIVIGRVLSVALVTPFSVAGRLMQYFDPVINGIVSPMLPVMSELDGRRQHQELRQFFLRATKLTALVTLLIGSILVLDAREVLRVWVGEPFVSTYPLVVILLIGYVFELAQRPSATVLVAAGHQRPLGSWTLAEGLANLGLSIYWGHKYGLIGVALGTTVPLVAVKLTLQPWYTLRALRLSLWQYLKHSLAGPAAATVVFLLFGYGVMSLFSPTGLLQLVGTVSWQCLAFAGLAYWVALTQSERGQVWQRLGRLALGLRVSPVAVVKA